MPCRGISLAISRQWCRFVEAKEREDDRHWESNSGDDIFAFIFYLDELLVNLFRGGGGGSHGAGGLDELFWGRVFRFGAPKISVLARERLDT